MTIYAAYFNLKNPLLVEGVSEHDSLEEVPEGHVVLEDWVSFPTRPEYEAAQLRLIEGSLVWVDLREDLKVREDKWKELQNIRNEKDNLPIELSGIGIQADFDSRQKVMGAVVAMQLYGVTSKGWICSDNVRRELTFAQILAFGSAIDARTQELYDTGDTLRSQVFDPLKTIEEVKGISWP